MMTRISKNMLVALITLIAAGAAVAQSEGSYDVGFGSWGTGIGGGGEGYAGLLDPSRLSINHAMSFYAGGTNMSSMKSQSMYSTMIRYHFDAPVMLSLNFDMPIHSTFNQHSNFSSDNLQSLDYFKNMPIDAAITWMPTQNTMFGVRVIKMPESGSPFYGYNHFASPFHHNRFYRDRDRR